MRRKKKTTTLFALSIGLGLALVLIASTIATFAYFSYRRVFVSTNLPTSEKSPQATPTPPPDPNAPFGILLMGFGGPNHDGGYLTDTMIVALVQPKVQQIALVSIPRDIWVELPVSDGQLEPFKINAAYAIGRDNRRYPHKPAKYQGEAGGGILAKEVATQVTGLPIKYFVALSFQGFVKSINTLGGVTVNVPVTFDDAFYPVAGKEDDPCEKSPEEIAALSATMSGYLLEQAFPCRYEHLHFDAGKQSLDGETALKFVRSRHSGQSGGDYARSARQRALLLGIKEGVFTANFVPKLIPFLSNLTWDMQMDIEMATMQEWVGRAPEFQQYEITSISLTEDNILVHSRSSNGQYILMPKAGQGNWSSIHQFIQDELNQHHQAATASGSLQP